MFTLRSSFFQGRPPKSVNMFWRRIPVSSIPIDDPKAFEAWIHGQWEIKEALLEGYAQNGRFPADDGQHPEKGPEEVGAKVKVVKGPGFIETRVRLIHWYELGLIFVVPLLLGGASYFLAKIYNLAVYGNSRGLG